MMQVSIVIACRNERKHMREFLGSVLAQDLGPLDWETIVADGMSDDGTREFLDEFSQSQPRLRVISNPGRIVSTGLNAAIRSARGEIVIRMDAHTFYAPDYCRRCVEILVQTGADNVGGPARTRPSGLLSRANAAAYHSRFSTGGARFHDVDYEGWVDTVTYGCWKKETLARLGLFDETLVRNQDDELNLRIERSGGRIWQSPKIVSWYTPRGSIGALFRQYFQYGFWKVAVIRKHRRPASWRHLVPVAFVTGQIALLIATFAAAAAGSWLWLDRILLLWAASLASYCAVLLLASVDAARRGGWEIFPFLPLIFATYHVSYGSGFLLGLMQPAPMVKADSVYTQLSR